MSPFRRFALLAAAGALIAGASACGGDEDPADDAPAAEFAVADTDLAPESSCAREGESFVLDAQVTNDDEQAGSYIVTATVQSAEDRQYRASEATDVVTIQAGETIDVALDGFGTDAPGDATCTITASKKQSTD